MMAHLKWYLDPLSPHQLKKTCQIWTPSDRAVWIGPCTPNKYVVPVLQYLASTLKTFLKSFAHGEIEVFQ